MTIRANIVDILQRQIRAATVTVADGKIAAIDLHGSEADPRLPFILPGFIDAHVHIESSMLVPSEFARLASVHGTVGTVSDPHEIANVCGMRGVEFMLENGRTVNFKSYFGAPSCVPATAFETAGACIGVNEIRELMGRPEIRYLSEMMNFPGVIAHDGEVMQKIEAARRAGKPVDGHAPGLTGEPLKAYRSAGITTDHECFTEQEAREKLALGMKILIREGSAAKNFEALIGVLNEFPEMIMFCSDDKHPDSLVKGHINELCRRAVAKGIDVFKVLRAACINPILHYRLDIGLLQPGDPADFILVGSLTDFNVQQTWINGECVAADGQSRIPSQKVSPINQFDCVPLQVADLACPAESFLLSGKLPVIEALDGQLVTNLLMEEPAIRDGAIVGDPATDTLKLVVVNRYHAAPVAKSFIRHFGLRSGAIASSVAHDSHNIIATGADDDSICRAINSVIRHGGGISCVDGRQESVLPLPVAGLMSADDGYQVAAAYTAIDAMSKALGSSLSAPFMTLSFMALLVIPAAKLSDKGLFDGRAFRFLYNIPR